MVSTVSSTPRGTRKHLGSLLRYANPRLVGKVEPWNDDDPWPVSSSAMFVVDPVTVVDLLKAGDWADAHTLVGSFRDAERYFFRYTEDGRAHLVLKERYAANQAVIHAKFDELTAWIEQQKQQQADRDR